MNLSRLGRSYLQRATLLLLAAPLFAIPLRAAEADAPPGEIIIGIEYAMPGPATEFAKMGVGAVKFYPDQIPWGKMQSSPEAAIDFRQMDRVVKEYQDAGFQDLVICLKSLSSWGSKDATFLIKPKNIAPKPEHMPKYAAWVRSVVERYDHDGKDDMPGLRRAVRHYEIGSEFSTFEPEPVEDYLPMLEQAYKAAHAASPNVQVYHAAFLTTTVFQDHPAPPQYEAAFAAAEKRTDTRILQKKLSDLRAVLDRTEIFDAVNFHALGDPYEIEDTVAWLRYEMKKRRIDKPLIISDTTPSPLIGWGPATRARGAPNQLGIVVPPATEADRPRLAAHFTKLIDEDAATLQWTHAFVAADMVQKVVIAAEQKIALINTCFMEDLFPFKTKLAMGGAGTSAWAGMAEVQLNLLTQTRTVKGYRPSFYAIGQVQRQIRGYQKVQRVGGADKRHRIYQFSKPGGEVFVAWLDPGKLVLPEDETPKATAVIKVGGGRATVEKMIDQPGQTNAERESLKSEGGSVRVTLTPRPVFVVGSE